MVVAVHFTPVSNVRNRDREIGNSCAAQLLDRSLDGAQITLPKDTVSGAKEKCRKDKNTPRNSAALQKTAPRTPAAVYHNRKANTITNKEEKEKRKETKGLVASILSFALTEAIANPYTWPQRKALHDS